MMDDTRASLPHPLRPYPPLIINAALTGMVSGRGDSPFPPLSAEDIARDAAACREAGAAIVHLHARDADGQPTCCRDVYADVVHRVREAAPDLIICVSTSGRRLNTFEARSEVLGLDGDLKPDMASLTLGSVDFPEGTSVNEPERVRRLAEAMRERGIVPELEVFDLGMVSIAKVLIRKGVLAPPHYCNLLLGSIYSTPATVLDLAVLANALPASFTWSVGGIGRFQQAMNCAGVLMGGHVRTGLEDNLFYDAARTRLATNAELVARVARFAQELGREVATPEAARALIGLPPRGRG